MIQEAKAHTIALDLLERGGQASDPGWRRFARCVQDAKPVSWFFPNRSENVGRRPQLKSYCRECPTRVMCLAVTMTHERLGTSPTSNRHGFAGGLSGAERDRLASSWGPQW